MVYENTICGILFLMANIQTQNADSSPTKSKIWKESSRQEDKGGNKKIF